MGELGDIEPIRELVYRHLRERILSGRFQYGTRLIETDISQELGVSRTPVREALRKLELEGLVRYLNRRGVMVTNLAAHDMDEIYALREVLEGLSARLAAERGSDADIRQIVELAEAMELAYRDQDLAAVTDVHTRFNELLYGMGANRRLHEILSRYNEYIAKSQLVSMTRHGRADEIMAEHRAIVEAIVQRNPEQAEATARVHVHNARRAFFEGDEVTKSLPAPGRDGHR